MSRHLTLSELESRADSPWMPRPIPPARMPPPHLVGSGDCWCGEPVDHDWSGKDGGAPHPR
jgi:hypothetical protein